MASNPLERAFRKSALDRLMSPERLDELLQVTKPRGWLSLLAFLGVLVAAFYWAASSTIPVTVTSRGLLLREQGINLIQAPAEGVIQRVVVRPGDTVQQGAVIAFLKQVDRDQELAVTAPSGGRVQEVRLNPGSYVTGGTPLATIEPTWGDLMAVVYVPAGDAIQIQEGMDVWLALETYPPEAFGYLVGSVQRVGQFPSTRDGMLRLLGHEDMVMALSGEHSAFEVRITLKPDTETPSGLTWTASSGPDQPLESGMMLSARIILREFHPIDFIVRPNAGRSGPS